MQRSEDPPPTVWDEANPRRPRRRQVSGRVFWLSVVGMAAAGVALLWAVIAAGELSRGAGAGLLALLAIVGGWEIGRWSPSRDRRERARARRDGRLGG